MKRLLTLLFSASLFSACTFYDVEPRYDSRDQIVGYYDVKEYSETYNGYTYYEMRISKSSYSYQEVYLHNFYAADIRIYAVLDFGKLRIPQQVVDGYEVDGVGTVNGNDLHLQYRVRDLYNNSYTDFCETVALRDF